jgi:hypothetical protein
MNKHGSHLSDAAPSQRGRGEPECIEFFETERLGVNYLANFGKEINS